MQRSYRRSQQPVVQRRTFPTLDRTNVWNVPFDRVTLGEAIDHIEALIANREPSYVITANLNYVMLHHQQADIPEVTSQAALMLADGQPIVVRSKFGDGPLPERVAGSEMIFHLAKRASERNWGIYFLGGEPGVADICAERLQDDYPGMRIAGVESPPFRKLSTEERAEQLQRIQEAKPDILLVAFGQPKGERWIFNNYQRLGVPVSIQLGASFDFVAGAAKRAPKVWQRLGAEWLYRMLSDPKRLAPRYADNAKFLARQIWNDLRDR